MRHLASSTAIWRDKAKVITLCAVKTDLASDGSPRPGYGPLPTPQMRRRLTRLSTARAGILDVLINQPEPCTVAALSAPISQHPNTIREHLDKLVTGGLVVRDRAVVQGRGRPAWLYSAVPEVGSDQGNREYAALASALAAHIERTSPHPGADAIEAGWMWGQTLVREAQVRQGQGSGRAAPVSAVAARRKVVALLDELGFAPTADGRVRVVKLHRCPLLEAAHRNPLVVCSVHLGMVRGALEELGADPERTAESVLLPFSEPGACRLDLLRRSTPAG